MFETMDDLIWLDQEYGDPDYYEPDLTEELCRPSNPFGLPDHEPIEERYARWQRR